MSSLIVNLLLAAFAAGAQDSSTRLMGRVLDAETSQPLAGATIAFLPMGQTPRPPLPSGPLRTETNGRGAFTMDLPPGRYRLLTQRAGFINDPGVVITIDGGTVTVPDIRLARGGAVEGRILDVNGRPVTGVSVFAVRQVTSVLPGSGPAMPVGRNARTDDRGEYRLSGLPSGSYYVLAQPRPRTASDRQASTPVTSVETYYPGLTEISAASAVAVTAGDTTRAIDFRMQQATTVTVSGLVVDHADRPVAGAVVYFSERRGLPLSSSSVRTERDGTFRIALPGGTYRVVAGAPSADGSVRVASAPGAGVEILVDGVPVTGVKVVAQRP